MQLEDPLRTATPSRRRPCPSPRARARASRGSLRARPTRISRARRRYAVEGETGRKRDAPVVLPRTPSLPSAVRSRIMGGSSPAPSSTSLVPDPAPVADELAAARPEPCPCPSASPSSPRRNALTASHPSSIPLRSPPAAATSTAWARAVRPNWTSPGRFEWRRTLRRVCGGIGVGSGWGEEEEEEEEEEEVGEEERRRVRPRWG